MLKALLLLIAIATAPLAAQQGYVVIVNDANSVSSVNATELSRMFMKKLNRWESGLDVVPVDLPESAAAREAFSAQVHGKSVSAVHAFWQQQIFSGRAVPPAEKASDEQVIAFVRSTPGAVGYVSAGASLSGVKRVQVVR
jgi:ABC-type phosphate transport system substrate-binding protein